MTTTSYKREQVVDIINSVLLKVQSSDGFSRDVLGQELSDLKYIIESLRSDLQSKRPNDISDSFIPNASQELDAVVGATETATQTIMDCCDAILNAARDGDQVIYQQVEKNIVQIFEACTFQDITGQRIQKVITGLMQIDNKIKSVLSAIEFQLGEMQNNQPAPLATTDPLLNGPALPGQAVSQEEIDRLLAEFDSQ